MSCVRVYSVLLHGRCVVLLSVLEQAVQCAHPLQFVLMDTIRWMCKDVNTLQQLSKLTYIYAMYLYCTYPSACSCVCLYDC